MKKMIAFTFAAVAAVALGGGAQDDVTSWYTPAEFKTLTKATSFKFKVGEYEEYIGISVGYNKNGGKLKEIWIPESGTGDAAIDMALRATAWSNLEIARNTERIETLANTIYNKAITRIVQDDDGNCTYYTENAGGGESEGGKLKLPKYTVVYIAAEDKYQLKRNDAKFVGEKWQKFHGADGYSIEGATNAGTLKHKLEIKGWNQSEYYGGSDVAKALESDSSLLDDWEVVMRDNGYNVQYVKIGKLGIVDYLTTNFVSKIETGGESGDKHYRFLRPDGEEVYVDGSTSMPVAKNYKVVDNGGTFTLHTSGDGGGAVAESASWSTNFTAAVDDESIVKSDSTDKLMLRGFAEGASVTRDLAKCLTNGTDGADYKLVIRSASGGMKGVSYMDLGRILPEKHDCNASNVCVTAINVEGEGDAKHYVFKTGSGSEISISGGSSATMPVAKTYEVGLNANAEYFLKDSNDSQQGLAWVGGHKPDDASVQEFLDGEDNKLQIYGWDVATAYGDSLAKRLTDGDDEGMMFYRNASGNLAYFSLGKLDLSGSAAPDADEHSIHKHIEGATTNLQVFGFASADVGGVPYKAPAGSGEGAASSIAWIASDTEGAVLVSGGSDTAPRFTAKADRNYYYGTSKPADPGETVLGWHELPNVTTNYVEGDERTITADNTIDEESGEVCKKLKLYTEPTGNNWTEDRVYGAYMDGEGHLAWQPIIGDKIAPLLADGITTTNNGGKVGIYGFADAQTLTYLRKASSNSVEWASLGGLVAAKHGIVLEPNTNSQFIVTMQNYTNAATRSTATARNNVLLSRDVDGNLEWLTDVDMVGLQQIVGIGAVKAEPDGQISSAYDVKLHPSSDIGTVITGVDNDGNWTRMEVAGILTNYWHLLPREVVTNLVNDIYVKRAGDWMFGALDIRAGLTAASAGFNEMTSGVAVVTGAMSADTLTVTNVCNLPFFDQTFVSYGTNETGEVLSCDLNEFTVMVAGDVAAVTAAEKVAEATNAMSQAWSVGQFTTTGTTELNAATTIGGQTPALVEPGESQTTFFVDMSGYLHVKAGGRHWKVQMTEVFDP